MLVSLLSPSLYHYCTGLNISSGTSIHFRISVSTTTITVAIHLTIHLTITFDALELIDARPLELLYGISSSNSITITITITLLYLSS